MIVAGCDVGATTAKAAVIKDGAILGTEVIRSRPDSVLSATEVMDCLLGSLGLSYGDIDRCVSTGYGRDIVPFAQTNISEVSCHGKGAIWLTPSVRTIIDGGGQDYKALSVDGNGRLKTFRMSGKYAAGTGRALELMSESLGVDVSEIGELSLRSTSPEPLKPICSTLTKITIRRLVLEGVPTEDIAAGIIGNAVHHLMVLIDRSDIEKDIVITGGIAKNIGVVEELKKRLKMDFIGLPEDPQVIGAIGAAVFAADQLINPHLRDIALPIGLLSGSIRPNLK